VIVDDVHKERTQLTTVSLDGIMLFCAQCGSCMGNLYIILVPVSEPRGMGIYGAACFRLT
jgi:hypothetical protein